MSRVMVGAQGIVNRFGQQTVHDGLNMEVMEGEVFGVVGSSGSGKTVLLQTILGLHRPNAGQVSIAGRDITQLSEAQLREVKRQYGVTFQHGALFSSLTVRQNVQLPMTEFYDFSPQMLDELANLKLRMVGLSPEAGAKYPAQLSGGMIKRAALARALALDPKLLFLDEPTAGLDPIAAAAFDELLLTLQKNLELTVVMITHDLDTLFKTCNRVGVIVDRKMIVDSMQGILQNRHPWIHEYFHGPRAERLVAEPMRAAQTSSRPDHGT